MFSGRRDLHDLKFAEYLEAATKYTTQLAGTRQRYGYAHDGFVGESTTLAFLEYTGGEDSNSESWLPWLTNAELDPLQRLKDTFGSVSILGAEAQLQSENGPIYPAPGSVGWGTVPGSH